MLVPMLVLVLVRAVFPIRLCRARADALPVQRLMLSVRACSAADERVLVRVRVGLAAVHALPVWTLGLRQPNTHTHATARALLRRWARSRAGGPRGALEHRCRILDERLRHCVSRVVRRAVVLVLRVRRVVVRERGRVPLLRALLLPPLLLSCCRALLLRRRGLALLLTLCALLALRTRGGALRTCEAL